MRKVLSMKNIISVFILVLTLALLSGCSKVSDEDLRAAHIAADKGAMIIDVRSKKEYNTGHINGAVNIPIDILDKMYGRLPRDKEMIVYCRSGSRSMVAAHLLKEQGWIVHDVATQEDWGRELSPLEK